MCLYVDEKETRLIKRRFAAAKRRGKNYIVCYKIVKFVDNKIYSPYYPKEYKPGWNKSNRRILKLTKNEKIYVNRGIHVMTSNSSIYVDIYENEIIIPVRCYEKDFISGGETKEAVFTKVFISRKDYEILLERIVND